MIAKTCLAVIVAVWAILAQSISISGKVTDTNGVALSGAAVNLEKAGVSATSDSDGSFRLSRISGIRVRPGLSAQVDLRASVVRGKLEVIVGNRSLVDIAGFTLQGKELTHVQKNVEAGTYSMALPHHATGLNVYRIRCGKNEVVIRGGMQGGSSEMPGTKNGAGFSAQGLTKSEHITSPISDVISVTMTGYLDYRQEALNSDTSGIEIKMITSAGSVTDIDGNVYQTVKYGNQEWTAQNLRVTHYNDGTPIPHIDLNADWDSTIQKSLGAYCYHCSTNVDTQSRKRFGALYNWYAVNTGKLAPSGWHVPNDTEWMALQNYLINHGYNWDSSSTGNKIGKAMASKTDWFAASSSAKSGAIGNNAIQNNRSGFSGYPAGVRGYDGTFWVSDWVGKETRWWSTNESPGTWGNFWTLYKDQNFLGGNSFIKSCGMSVRLLKN
jgi:uncharacterized protein (TIGR02145 family)